jgi:hypothetical protein
MTWHVEWGSDGVATGNASRVMSSDPEVEAVAHDVMSGGWVDVTPVGPRLRLPDEAATWLAFTQAMNEVWSRRGDVFDAAALLTIVSPPPAVVQPDDTPGVVY